MYIILHSERRRHIVESLFQGSVPDPYLKIKVRRNYIIDDALIMVSNHP